MVAAVDYLVAGGRNGRDMNTPALMQVYAASPDGAWRFQDGKIRSETAVVAPFEIDFFERWTFARFLPTGQLALAFESGQPWDEGGSYGDRYGGVQVLALTAAPATWSLVAFEFDYRACDETFVPDDVIWHPRGVLAWLHDDTLFFQVLAAPRGVIPVDIWPRRDSDIGLAFSSDLPGRWRTLSLDDGGNLLSAADEDGIDRIDLARYRRARDGGAWRPLTG